VQHFQVESLMKWKKMFQKLWTLEKDKEFESQVKL